jgi:hypothetical protein
VFQVLPASAGRLKLSLESSVLQQCIKAAESSNDAKQSPLLPPDVDALRV